MKLKKKKKINFKAIAHTLWRKIHSRKKEHEEAIRLTLTRLLIPINTFSTLPFPFLVQIAAVSNT